ncbi:sugar ABC transporter substrate-binding protein [Micromonospora sp. HM5-17]|jgi:ABC-type glycerol-3-phosphate transport system substrate-binding protein|uniref:ABC transporter substrate-binding protein n=1 Tax=Micromonospora sp. HM5-17 TaxID=2487710 RepID=UPI000F48EA6C|nr:sugar ABC transporter substrate-binding protein [Micromonospora sp. HM5-17]ROT32480.1 sugar ABC transporter substrate-binding protein [Micromonospora sp. HM5-17]
MPHRFTRRRFVGAALAGALALGPLAACGSDDGGSDGPVTLRFLSLAWQKESLQANKDLVAKWNAEHPDIQVEYVQGDWNSIHDQLLTSFEGGDAPDIVHYEAAAIGEFSKQGYLADLSGLLSDDFKAQIDKGIWDTVTFDGKVTGIPFLLESQVVIANKKLLDDAGIPVPPADGGWTWDEFQANAKKLTKPGQYGVAWALKSPTNRVMNLALNFDGKYFYTEGGKTEVRVGTAETEVPRRIHDMLYTAKSAAPEALGMSGADTLPGFFAGKYAMIPGSVSLRQQMVEQAPAGFEWVTLPPIRGISANQAANPQTLSVSADSKHQKEAVQFLEFFLNPTNMAQLAKGDWLVPTGKQANEELVKATGGKQGWDVAADSVKDLTVAPFQMVDGYPEWKTKYATPALQQYFANKITLDQLATQLVDGGKQVLR